MFIFDTDKNRIDENIPVDQINYIALKLDDESRNRLLGLERSLFGGAYPEKYCDHVTLAYGPDQTAAFDTGLFGEKAEIESCAVIYDDRAAALFIGDQIEYLGANNEYPHITMSTADGTKPVYSNELIQNYFRDGSASMKQLEIPVQLVGTVIPVPYRRIHENTGTIAGLDGYSYDELTGIIRDFIDERLDESGVDIDIKGIKLHGSRIRGDSRPDSDLDAVVEYEGHYKEYFIFDVLNEEPQCMIDGIAVDINPIREEETGTLTDYMAKDAEYDRIKKSGR